MGRMVQEESLSWVSEEKRALIYLAAERKSGLAPEEFDKKLQVGWAACLLKGWIVGMTTTSRENVWMTAAPMLLENCN